MAHRPAMTEAKEPVIAARKPMLATLAKKGDRVFWCACGRSKSQPFCDGSHKGTGFSPVPYVAQQDNEEVLFCACKRTGRAPICDGSHNNLGDKYEAAGKDEIAASASTPVTPAGGDGVAYVDGGAFIFSPEYGEAASQKGWRVLSAVDAARGANFISVYLLETDGAGAPLCFADKEMVFFILEGTGVAAIGEKRLNVIPECAIAVRPGERFSLHPSDGAMRAFAVISPQTNELTFAEAGTGAFDDSRPNRTACVNPGERKTMGDRFYQVLADAATGAEETTLFIGEIPKSRAAAHRHLYEEAIVILSGEGYLWTENARAAVKPGDIIFLPRKQLHSLECTDDGGMRLAGAFYPSGSPAINY